ncbi:hypothetical protein SAMN02745753_00998 [Marinomonas polaris DSM 16579]|uniref:DUF917 family protein n=1 Tax=Marinomonas polaris DSM 16579 TaxID=1122206 RepID=A0A1M4X7V7_9GAMM|nr:DUF917 family protein [Marinomonas polaris]SHE89546.1 hypothetical protein SAMN02745753_00998 [Marinomonas polaris DSM 16579]
MTILTTEALFNIVNGSTLLASGGGGSIKTAYSFVNQIVETKKSITLCSPGSMKHSDFGVVVGAMGSPESFEKIGLQGAEKRAVEVMQDLNKSKRINFTISVETGSNIFVAMLAAAKTLDPALVIDADGAGRSVPTLSCLSYSSKINITPFVVLNAPHGEVLVEGDIVLNLPQISDGDLGEATKKKAQASIVENMVRPILSSEGSFDGVGAISGWIMNGNQAKSALVSNTISMAQSIGEQLNKFKVDDKNIIHDLAVFLNTLNISLYSLSETNSPFILKSKDSVSQGGFDFNKLSFTQTVSGRVREQIVINQNENLLIWDKDKDHPLTICPDSICMLGKLDETIKDDILAGLSSLSGIEKEEADTSLSGWHGLSVEDLVEGQEVYLFSLPAPETLKNENQEVFSALAKQFGYYGSYESLDKLLTKENI